MSIERIVGYLKGAGEAPVEPLAELLGALGIKGGVATRAASSLAKGDTKALRKLAAKWLDEGEYEPVQKRMALAEINTLLADYVARMAPPPDEDVLAEMLAASVTVRVEEDSTEASDL